ncbi:MAG: PleD family two-component response regulator [Clostridium sp.]|jgi:PleD family two-component response regulator
MFSPEKQPDGRLTKEKAFEMYTRAMKDGSSLLPVEIMMTTIVLNGKKVFHALLRDIRERKLMEDRLQYLSYHDQLTGLYNRRFFEEALIEKWVATRGYYC